MVRVKYDRIRDELIELRERLGVLQDERRRASRRYKIVLGILGFLCLTLTGVMAWIVRGFFVG